MEPLESKEPQNFSGYAPGLLHVIPVFSLLDTFK